MHVYPSSPFVFLLLADLPGIDLTSINGIIKTLFYLTPTRNLLYVTDTYHGRPSHTLEHLSCFLPGLLALGVQALGDEYLPPKMKEVHQWAAEGLAYTCYLTYVDQETGLGPDEVKMEPGERWIEALEKWEAGGRQEEGGGGMGKPPGLKEGGRKTHDEAREREYWNSSPNYLLRPEVRWM